MSYIAPNAELLQLSLDLWSEASVEHTDVKHSECAACWKAHMANLLWKTTTGLLAPNSYYDEHRAAVRRNANVVSLLGMKRQAA